MSNDEPPIDKNKLKDELRDSRFHFRNLAEHELRRDLKEEAMAKCDPEIKAFAECSQENGLWVVWTCRDLFKKVNDCMHVYNSEEVWQKYRKETKPTLKNTPGGSMCENRIDETRPRRRLGEKEEEIVR